MQIIKVSHKDFDMVIECNNLEATFHKAQQKQTQIGSATTYTVNEGDIAIYHFETGKLESLLDERTHPLIFENKDYFIGITFKSRQDIQAPHIHTRLKEWEDKFFYREAIGFLAGSVNFGNDLGSSSLVLRYTKGQQVKEIIFIFEVFPVKLDYRNDHTKIIADIEKEYPFLVLDFLKKTYTTFSTGSSPNTNLIWWQVFGGLYKDFMQAAQFILNKPHNRIVKQAKQLRAEKIIKWTPAFEEEYAQSRNLPGKIYRSEYKSLGTDTAENRFFKFALFQTIIRYKKIRVFIQKRFSSALSDGFLKELNAIEQQLHTIAAHPFFKTIGSFQGIRQESLVLQKATGYSTIYRSWIMLRNGLKFIEGIQQMELKNIADLYQIWCFLEIKQLLQKIIGKNQPDGIELATIEADDFVFTMDRGQTSRVSFRKPDGDTIDLFHELSYDKGAHQNVKSFTVSQRPDIVLRITKNDLKDNYELTYLFDAKYRLASDYKEGAPDLPTEDGINQMHRYRDAIYYINKQKKRPEKEVVGAYILFPGSGDIDSIRDQDYYKAIEAVNIGAFPLRPHDYTNKALLEAHLRHIIDLDTASLLHEVAPQKESHYESPNPYVLIGFVATEGHKRCFEGTDTPFYYSGPHKPAKFGFPSLKYFAPYIKGKGIKDYYEILSYDITPRSQIAHAPIVDPLDHSERLVIRLGRKIAIAQGRYFKIADSAIGQIPYRYTSLKHIRTPEGNKIRIIKAATITPYAPGRL